MAVCGAVHCGLGPLSIPTLPVHAQHNLTDRLPPYLPTHIQFNLSDFTRRAYGTNYIETLRVQIHANCRIRRIYFSDRLYSEEELPPEFKLFLPIQKVRVCLHGAEVVCVYVCGQGNGRTNKS